ncbi:hypothetical protein SAM23877_0351 [Streptomyces ambofaciens ATCC 23877]|uniref:Uncharacterized protein n=1 Tax=Streptomyces ambofaciens (strain ATCC 23877 / 3486 / DSM 40053 / JCM 4204 / NBRC 12836 / NRRL B-2516) TaxID=278992 RepID=A3KHW4_STRA7|nr:hypothetical protein SAM23877_0351 [Streptomyces ambofaciens ATCC 23877]CAJ89291.1 conserved hypothetical protein [Streptomyces ambofaciens ATCC 23877]
MSEAAVFPLTPSGVSEAEQMARRIVAYQVAVYHALPDTVRVAAAAAPEAIDVGRHRHSVRAAVTALALTAYDCRAARRADLPGTRRRVLYPRHPERAARPTVTRSSPPSPPARGSRHPGLRAVRPMLRCR